MITNNKKYRIKWIHWNHATNNQNNPERKESHTDCFIYDFETDELLRTGASFLSSKDKNYCKAVGRYYATKRAMAGMKPEDQVDILNSLDNLPSHKRWVNREKPNITFTAKFNINMTKNKGWINTK